MKKQVVVRDRDNNKFKVSVDKLTFRPSVYGVIIKTGKILLARQWDGYEFPGGGINLHETIEEGLKREVWEETGYKVRMGNILHSETSFFTPAPYYKGVFWNCVLIYYICSIVSGKISTKHFDDNEKKIMSMAEWVDLKDIGKLKFYNSIDSAKLIKKALEIKS
ncbi:hypothetical protein COU00_03180 [Candidatus Falkowbacteria bacterium CG10_big_fil_rev_8_21_14_0_10_43_11]|uniref:Nudix hydrolase domain-containing protein n=1 Tax=Candidatus Falkowbacteria bacterium CG10_big_fil_rev_8_21_14_0_10_43_11 TaxID=1974568 RepID=A0A2M6WLJ1_9BACT|nr:MAG: hypothetical protein COU00_03180 [Candidatus Falkowbacteria bacterium CG10_big_fil_rev_8_21_14_0_10_43_11]